MTASVVVLALVTLQRLGELILARRNTRRLLARGAVEVAPGHYGLIVALHAAWLAGLWLLAPGGIPHPIWLVVFVGLQAGRLWILAALGERWTTRIIVLPGAPLVQRGPYRFVSHPNYAVVVGEIAALPLAFGLTGFAFLFSILNAAILTVRLRAEGTALKQNLPA
ncbi:isoprenylcysteine carboxyl methyltransferase family protein [Methylobacterium crusticola]|uniref:isoprenylcysteine carboxyl methyltransferase family protein n=1 Tax=Methylobacterium crusticola TaxID=1697972 RepID=UPI000FFB4831|nr:isoprenylcysteine carboxylmethyltransferase family protein [Methylobacterium crusticola]